MSVSVVFTSRSKTTSNIPPDFVTSADSTPADRLESVIDLWKANRSTLGLFPRGAFEDHAKNNWILYLLEKNIVKGYLLYRVARNRVVISHLCTSEDVRGKGGAKMLFSALKDVANDGHCRGIEVRCRSDYEISRMWPRLGFECIRNISGRAKSGSELTIWFYKFDVPDFFYDMQPKQDDDDRTWAILDANIVFKLTNPDDKDSEESRALMSESISSYTRYFVTPEIFIETERKKDVQQKKQSNNFARKFEKIEVKQSTFEEYKRTLAVIWGEIKTDRDRSDLNHIAYGAAAGFHYFITQDGGLIEKADLIYDACNITVLRPVDFITQLDQIEDSNKYTPRSISRTKYTANCPSSDEITSIANHFCMPSQGEKRRQLEARIRAAIANPNQYKTILISNEEGHKLALLCFKRDSESLSVEILRHSGDIISKTIAQNFAWGEIFAGTDKELSAIRFSDTYSSETNDELFQETGFIRSEDGWVRISANTVGGLEETKRKIKVFAQHSETITESVRKKFALILSDDRRPASNFEEIFWPAKIADHEIPTYLIPIQPIWALHLFDKSLAEKDLWGADPTKHFNVENVYYRSPKPFRMAPGGRILWYVSSGGNHRISEIRACSRLLAVELDSAKTLFQKYKRLGIYEWRNLMEITKGDPEGDINALRFYQTEHFRNPIALSDFSEYGINGQPFGPKAVTNDQFIKIYHKGMNGDVW